MRRIVTGLVLVAVFLLVLVGTADAYTITGGDAVRQTMARNVLNSRPVLVSYVESVWPLSVRINYGGHAFAGGRMDVNTRYVYPRFTWNVAHELGHMIQLAADAPGGHPGIGSDWLQLLRDRGFPDSMWVYGGKYEGGRYDPWECFAENVSRAYFAPYYTGRTTPNTCLAWLSRAEMRTFLAEHGVAF